MTVKTQLTGAPARAKETGNRDWSRTRLPASIVKAENLRFLHRVSERRSQRLEPCAAKVASTVLRGGKGRNPLLLLY